MSHAAEVWTEKEFATVGSGNARPGPRFRSILIHLTRHCGRTLASSFDALSRLEANHRFLANARVTLRAMLQPHIVRTLGRVPPYPSVLTSVSQDTTFSNFERRAGTAGLDVVNRSSSNEAIEGLIHHDTLAFTKDGLPPGLLNRRFINRKAFYEDAAERARARRSRASKAIRALSR